MATIVTIGTFDLFHYGHAEFLNACNKLGNLQVGINSDRLVTKRKGKPVLNEEERQRLLTALGYITFIYDGNLQTPDIFAVGSDWEGKLEEVIDPGCPVVYIPYTEGISTSEIKSRL
jgi:glycerol-3-phosphate cytidylyltransferase